MKTSTTRTQTKTTKATTAWQMVTVADDQTSNGEANGEANGEDEDDEGGKTATKPATTTATAMEGRDQWRARLRIWDVWTVTFS